MKAAPLEHSMRLDRFLSQTTGLSRTRVRPLLHQNRVFIDQSPVRDPSIIVSRDNRITLDNSELPWPRHYYVMLHKPAGVVCSTQDPVNTPVNSIIDTPWADQLHTAGRLDADTTGLVLLTSDGSWSHNVTSPRRECEKCYQVTLKHAAQPELVARFAEGLMLNGETSPTLPATLELLGTHKARVRVQEGRYHQIKRMFAACSNRVAALHRESIGTLMLDAGLQPGQWRELSETEVALFAAGPGG